MAVLCISYFNLYIRFIEKIKYATRHNVESSRIYKLTLIFIVYFLFSQKAKLCVTNFRHCEKIIFFTRSRISFSYFIVSSSSMFSLKKAKYTARCSVRNSIVYKEQFILFLYFLC